MLPFTLTQLGYVIELDKARHFGRAADACHVTQPTLSMQIQKLEDLLGVILFDRSKKPIEPTAIGVRVIEQARIVFAEVKRIEASISDIKGQISGPFSLGIIPTLAPFLIPRFVDHFATSFPEVQLTIEELQTEAIVDRLRQERLDAGVLVTPLNSPSIHEIQLFYEPFVCYLSENHVLNSRNSVKESELQKNDVWLLSQGHCFRDQAMSLCHSQLSNDTAQLKFESGNLETLIRLVDRGLGMTLLPLSATLDLPPLSLKKLKHFAEPVPTREVSLVHARTQLKSRILQALITSIRQSLPQSLADYQPKRVVPMTN